MEKAREACGSAKADKRALSSIEVIGKGCSVVEVGCTRERVLQLAIKSNAGRKRSLR